MILKKESFIRLKKFDLNKSDVDACMVEVNNLFSNSKTDSNTVYKKNLDSTHFSADSNLIKIALNEDILKVLVNYFDERVKLFDFRLLYSENNENMPIARDQLWHRDKFDNRSVRLWLYLTDCNDEHGPLQYLP